MNNNLVKRNNKFLYKKHSSLSYYICYYCSSYANTKDHCPAICYVEFFPNHEKVMVRSCILCNGLLSSNPFHTLESRCYFLLKKYKSKYKKLLNSVDWNDDEINELEYSLKSKILSFSNNKSLINKKINYLQSKIDFFEESL